MSFGVTFAQSDQSMSKKSESSMTRDKTAWAKVFEEKVSLKAGDEPIAITEVKLSCKGGATQDISLNTPLKAEGETRTLDLSGDSQVIEKIDISYKSPECMTGMKQDNTTITVMGLKAGWETASM